MRVECQLTWSSLHQWESSLVLVWEPRICLGQCQPGQLPTWRTTTIMQMRINRNILSSREHWSSRSRRCRPNCKYPRRIVHQPFKGCGGEDWTIVFSIHILNRIMILLQFSLGFSFFLSRQIFPKKLPDSPSARYTQTLHCKPSIRSSVLNAVKRPTSYLGTWKDMK